MIAIKRTALKFKNLFANFFWSAKSAKTSHEALINDIKKVNKRIDALKSLTLPEIKEIQAKFKKPTMYDNFKMFTYFIDQEFGVEQKKWFIEKQCMRALGYFPDLDNPKSLNEKIQWYKLNYEDPLITDCVDKYKFKSYVASVVGGEYVVPLLGVWGNAREIDFEGLECKFVLKSNWGSGSRHVLIVKDKDRINFDQVKLKLNNWIQPWENVYYHTFDWGYKNIEPKIIAEKLIENVANELSFYCFNGEPAFIAVVNSASPDPSRKSQSTRDFFNMDWSHLSVRKGLPNSKDQIERPKKFDEMVLLARKLSAPFPHVRVDFLNSETGLFVVEMTFYTTSGTARFYPPEWDYEFGKAFKLPPQRRLELRNGVPKLDN